MRPGVARRAVCLLVALACLLQPVTPVVGLAAAYASTIQGASANAPASPGAGEATGAETGAEAAEAAPAVTGSGTSCGSIVRVSVASDGSELSGGGDIWDYGVISGDGRYVVFVGYKAQSAGAPADEPSSFLVHDRGTGQTSYIATAGTSSSRARISADGRYVAFSTTAALVDGDTNGTTDAYVYDRQTAEFRRASVWTGGVQIDSGSGGMGDLSATARYVAFVYVPPSPARGSSLYVHDLETLETTCISCGLPTGSSSTEPEITADGRYITFMSNTTAGHGVYVYDRQTGETLTIPDGEPSDGYPGDPVISEDGRYVAFDSSYGCYSYVWVYDRETGVTSLASVASDGSLSNSQSLGPSISADGRYVAFSSFPMDPACSGAIGQAHAYVRDLVRQETVRVSVAWDGAEPNSDIYVPTISADGRYVAFSSYADNLVPGDTNGRADVFVARTPISTDRFLACETGCLSTPPPQPGVAEPVNSRTGNFTHQETDFSIPTRGMPLAFERSYNALDTTVGPLGRGWTHSYSMRLLISPYEVDLVAPRGSHLPFYVRPDGGLDPGEGVRATLAEEDDGTYTLTQGDHVVYRFDAAGRLVSQDDGRGNVTTLGYDGSELASITAADGRALTLAYDEGRIVSVTDPLSRTVELGYTGDNLTSVTDPAGQTWGYGYDDEGRMTSLSDPDGGTVTNEYDDKGRVVVQWDKLNQPTEMAYSPTHTVVTDTNGIPTIYSYNNAGVLTAVTDGLGQTTTYEHDDNYNVTAVTDPLNHTTRTTWNDCACQPASIEDAQGHVTTMTYDGRNNLLSRTDPLERTTRYAYDAQDNMIAMTNTLGVAATFSYNAYGQMTASTDLNGHLTQYGYDTYGNLTVITDTLGYTATTAYDLAGRAIAVTDARQHTTTTDYDALSRPITVTDALDGPTLFDYDALGHVTRITDANEKATRMAYDAAGRVITTTNALNDTTVRAYDPVGRLTSLTDANDKTTNYEYDATGRLTTTTDALGGQTAYGYDAAGNVTSVRDPSERTVTSEYDELNRLTAVKDGLGNTTTYGYDAVGNRTSTRDPSGVLVSNTYDELDRLRTVTNPIGTVATYEYDNAGNLLAVTDANNHTTTYTYDELDRLQTVRDALNGLTSYEYDEVGNLVTATDARNNATQRVYDALNRLQTVTNPLGQETIYGYDAVGNVTTMTDADDGVTTYDYDDLYRLTEVQYPDDSIEGYTSVSYTYDAVGNRLTMVDATGTTAYTYDELYRPESITAPRTGTVGYAYDAAGRRIGIDYPGEPTGEHAGYEYDAAGQLATVRDWAGKETGYTYDAAGRLLKAQLPNGVESEYGYDAAGRLTRVQHSAWQDTLTSYTYTLDPAGNRVEAREAVIQLQSYYFPALGRPELPAGGMAMAAAAALEPGEQTISYTYDDADRLTGAAYASGDSSGDSYSYTYDAVGNRTALETVLGGVSDSTSYTYDAGDRIAQVDDAITYDYDNRGNLTSDGAWTYTYDGAGRMVRAARAASVYTYTYNGDGLLVSETIDGVETLFTWDQAAGLPQVLATSDGTKNLYGLDRIGVEQGGAWRYPLPDALGSVRQWTDPAGAVLAVQSYGPFGEPRSPVGTPPWGFTGEWQDPAGMVYLRARWYNPALGRFTQVDPVAGELVAPATQHRYVYALGNALRYTDPTGEFTPTEIWRYLEKRYGDKAQRYWDAWSEDEGFWEMLTTAQLGDVLKAPTTSLPGGTFNASELYGFTLDPQLGSKGLEQYQGYGPYMLERGPQSRDMLDQFYGDTLRITPSLRFLFALFRTPVGGLWMQPIYRYTGSGPEATGYYRDVSYRFCGYRFDLLEGDNTPFTVAALWALIQQVASKETIKALAGPLAWFSFLSGVDSNVVMEYRLQVTWLQDEIRPLHSGPRPTYEPPPDLVE